MTTLLLSLTLLFAPSLPADAPSDQYAGFFGCTINGNEHHIVWIGTVGSGTRASKQYATYQVYSEDDFPFGDQIRAGRGSTYHTRDGGFNPGVRGMDFEGRTFVYRGDPCERVATVRDLLVLFDLDPADLAQEVMDLEGWTLAQTDARLDDADFAHAAFAPDAQFPTSGGHPFAKVVLGGTLPEPPPPPNAAPTGAPTAADDYEGIYSDGRMLYLVRDGRFIQFEDEYDEDWTPRVQYVFEPRMHYPRAYDYRVVNGEFRSDDQSAMEFIRRDGQVAALVWRGKELPRVYTLRQLFEAADYDLGHFSEELQERGMSDAEVKAVVDDAARFADVIREGNAPITFEKLTGLE